MSAALPLVLGIVSVLQAGLNRRVGETLGLAPATVINNLVLFVASLVLLLAARPTSLTATSTRLPIPLYVLPGILGLVLVAGIPAAISKLGALAVFMPLIAAQIAASVAWDYFYEGLPIGPARLAGSVLTLAGVLLVSYGKE